MSAPPPPPPPQPPPGAISVKGNHLPRWSPSRVWPWRVASLLMAARDDAGGGTQCARRRRERRLRSHLRHERMAVAMALAESTHHSAQRQKTARVGGEARDALHGHVPEAPLSPKGGFCGMLWEIFACLHLMFLCRRWWISCRTLSNSFVHSHLILSTFAQDPAFRGPHAHGCARSAAGGTAGGSAYDHFLFLWSSTSTFQFLVVEDPFLVFNFSPEQSSTATHF